MVLPSRASARTRPSTVAGASPRRHLRLVDLERRGPVGNCARKALHAVARNSASRGDVRERHARVELVERRRRGVVEGEHAGVPQERVEQRLPDLDGEDLADRLGRHEADHREDLAEPDPGLLLRPERLRELLVVEVAEVDEQLPEVLARIVRGGRDRLALAQVERLADRAALAGERAGHLAAREQLDEVGEREDREAAHEAAHRRRVSPGPARWRQARRVV